MAKLYDSYFFTAKQFMKLKRSTTATLVDEMIPAQGVTFLHGPSSAGKSALAWTIANAVSEGKPIFGLATTKARVLFVSLDMSKPSLHQRLFGTDKEKLNFDLKFDIFIPRLFPFVESGKDGVTCRKDFKKRIQPYRLIIIDALGSFVGDTNDAGNATLFYQQYNSVFNDKACILIHHDRKDQTDFSGSGRWQQLAEHQLHLELGKDDKRTLTQGKSHVLPPREDPWMLRVTNKGQSMMLYDEKKFYREQLKKAEEKAKIKIPNYNRLGKRKRDEILGEMLGVSDRRVRDYQKLAA